MTRLRLSALIVFVLAHGLTSAQTYPGKPVHLIVGFAPGGSTDVFARALAIPMAKELGQPVIVENKPGAGSSIAAEQVSKAAPDGYTLLLSPPSGYSVNPALNPKLDYAKNLLPVTLLGSSPLVVVVNASSPLMSIKDLIAAAKKTPGALNFATSPTVLGLVQSGRLRALAVTSRERSPFMPDIPGMAEAGLPAYDLASWYGLFMPAGTPKAIVTTVFDAATKSVQRPEVKAVLQKDGTEVLLSTSPQDFADYLVRDSAFWVQLVKQSGITVN
jgi:tripartite-type tricarboxylate transporter receptor subunit TctC